MAHFNYTLNDEDYTWKNALLWGNFTGHCKLAGKGTFKQRIVHGVIAAVQFLPIISQVASVAEKILLDNLDQARYKPITFG